jgi:hypothetical protein
VLYVLWYFLVSLRVSEFFLQAFNLEFVPCTQKNSKLLEVARKPVEAENPSKRRNCYTLSQLKQLNHGMCSPEGVWPETIGEFFRFFYPATFSIRILFCWQLTPLKALASLLLTRLVRTTLFGRAAPRPLPLLLAFTTVTTITTRSQ